MAYTKTNWQALPNTTTPINPTNLNHIEDGIKTNDDKLLGNTSMGSIKTTGISINNNSLDYEIGTFTPIVKGDTTEGTATYILQEGKYVRVGKLVKIEIRIGGTLSGSAGLLLVGGLPFNQSWVEAGIIPVVTNLTTADNPWLARVYGRNLILGTCNLGNITNKNWSGTNYIYITGTLMLP